MLIVLIGATLIAMFPPQEGQSKSDKTHEVLIVLAYGLLITLSMTAQMLLTKILANRGVDGKFIGLNFLIAEGIIGTSCLIVSTTMGYGLYETGVNSTLIMLLGGLTGFLAIGLLQYTISIGIAGVVCSIFNTQTAYFTVLCYLLLD